MLARSLRYPGLRQHPPGELHADPAGRGACSGRLLLLLIHILPPSPPPPPSTPFPPPPPPMLIFCSRSRRRPTRKPHPVASRATVQKAAASGCGYLGVPGAQPFLPRQNLDCPSLFRTKWSSCGLKRNDLDGRIPPIHCQPKPHDATWWALIVRRMRRGFSATGAVVPVGWCALRPQSGPPRYDTGAKHHQRPFRVPRFTTTWNHTTPHGGH